jgi:glutaminyl-tRNA synthetase
MFIGAASPTMNDRTGADETVRADFIRSRIRADIERGVVERPVTRFPPEPNGYLHIGHAKSICLNFGVAEEFGGDCYLRFDDTNPERESDEFVAAIQRDVRWLGFDWGSRLTFASDYFPQLYAFAEELIGRDKAFVCSLSAEEIRATRGTLTEPGRESPDRNRSIEENLDLFRRMRAGEFANGAYVLRAKIDMAAPNINLRDPVLYRIRHVTHHRTGDTWRIYPTYDYTHCICDALEGITHSLCTLEFEDHRPLYDWVLDNISVDVHPPQIEFSRLNLEYTVMSKRLYQRLIEDGRLSGWDDPRTPTIGGLRRRGVRPEAIRDFCSRIGVTKQEHMIEMNLLEFCIRQDLEQTAPRGMGVIQPLRVVITNYPEGQTESLEGPWHPQRAELGSRAIPFGREIFIEREDFAEVPPPKYKRLSPGEMVRLRYAYIIRCDEVVKDDAGEVVELRCRYVPDSRSGADTSGLKPKGVIHWVDASAGVPAEIRLYDRLFQVPNPSKGDLSETINPDSLETARGFVEPAIVESDAVHFQFERQGYFFKDSADHRAVGPVFNRTVTLRESWSR